MKLRTATFAATLLAVSWSAPLHAFQPKWYAGKPFKASGGDLQPRAGAGSFPADTPQRTALSLAVDLWNESPGAMYFSIHWGDTNQRRKNGQSEVWFTGNQKVLEGASGRAVRTRVYLTEPGPRITETDLIFDGYFPWSYGNKRSNKAVYGEAGAIYDYFVGALLHEMGHGAGLEHVDYLYNIMGSDVSHVNTNGNAVRAYVGEDAGRGDVYLYGNDPLVIQDLGVSHWKYAGSKGGYSKHERCEIYVAGSDTPAPLDGDNTAAGMPVYKASVASNFDVEFTYDNNGQDNQTGVNIGFYVSTNSKISTLDTKIDSTVFSSFKAGQPATLRHRVTIPDVLKNGNVVQEGQVYFLGVIVDDTGDISEITEKNNATYLAFTP